MTEENGLVIVIAIASALIAVAIAFAMSTPKPISAPSHVRNLGSAGSTQVYSITDLDKGVVCYVTDRDGISCLPDQ